MSGGHKPALAFALVAALCVFSAGCIAQDRPEHREVMVVADAGHHQVLPAGETAHFEFAPNRTLKVESGEPPHLEVEYAWSEQGSTHASTAENFSVTSATPGLVLVALNVTAEETTASDVAAVLFAPPAASTDRVLDLAFVGEIHVGGLAPSDTVTHLEHAGHEAESIHRTLTGAGTEMHFSIEQPADNILGNPVHGAILISVKDGVGPARTAATEPMVFASNSTYSLTVDTSPAAHHTITAAAPGQANVTVALETYAHDHPAEEEVEVAIVESQTLSGFEAAAALATTVALGSAMSLMRRRRL